MKYGSFSKAASSNIIIKSINYLYTSIYYFIALWWIYVTTQVVQCSSSSIFNFTFHQPLHIIQRNIDRYNDNWPIVKINQSASRCIQRKPGSNTQCLQEALRVECGTQRRAQPGHQSEEIKYKCK